MWETVSREAQNIPRLPTKLRRGPLNNHLVWDGDGHTRHTTNEAAWRMGWGDRASSRVLSPPSGWSTPPLSSAAPRTWLGPGVRFTDTRRGIVLTRRRDGKRSEWIRGAQLGSRPLTGDWLSLTKARSLAKPNPDSRTYPTFWRVGRLRAKSPRLAKTRNGAEKGEGSLLRLGCTIECLVCV